MNSRSLGATQVFAWPDAEVAVMGAKAAVGILHRKKLAAAPPRKVPKRLPRVAREPHEDPEAAHAGQPGPARSRRRVKPE